MDLLEAAALLAGKSRVEGRQAAAPTNVHLVTMEAVADSEDGTVLVDPGGDVFAPDESQYIELETVGSVVEGDDVNVLLMGEVGGAMDPIVIGGIGEGDRQDAAITDAAEAAQTAWNYADEAHSAASAAQSSAEAASRSAASAARSATDALAQLSFVEDVAGTLQWIQEHGTFEATSDTTVDTSKVYFELVSGEYVPIASPPDDANPQQRGWYELDTTEAQSDYIMAHLAVTSAGLWVLPSGFGQASSARTAPGYKMLLASDGAYLYDDTGHLVTTYSESITLDSSRPQYIGGENAYIVFYDSDDDGVPDTIRIGGSNVIIGGQRLSEVLSEVSTASQRAEAAMDICTIAITSTGGTVFKQNRGVSTTLIVTVFTGDGMRITDATTLHTRFGNGAYLQWKWKDSPEDEFSILVNTDPRIGAGGFTLTVSPSDISTQAIIDCDLIF